MNQRTPTDTREPGDADPEVAAAEARIVQDRERVTRSMLALRREVRRRLDWRAWVQRWANERPGALMGGALAVGLVLGWRSGGRTRRS
jgi:hypothetical protein